MEKEISLPDRPGGPDGSYGPDRSDGSGRTGRTDKYKGQPAPVKSGHHEVFAEKTAQNGVQYLYIADIDDRYPVRTFFTTRKGGVSKGAFDSLNLGYNTNDDPEAVSLNRQMVFSSMGVDEHIIAYPHQVHNDLIAHIDAAEIDLYAAGRGASDQISDTSSKEQCGHPQEHISIDIVNEVPSDRVLNFPDTDATITNRIGVILTSLHADCIPIWLYDPVNHVAGVAHAGWRGTRLDIAAKTAAEMNSWYGSQMKDIIAVIGPGISQCCFEVGAEVYQEFFDMLGDLGELAIDDKNGKYHLDLKGINRRLLERAGVDRVLVSDYCTSCRKDLFYSYRRDDGKTGRMCAGMVLL